MGVPDNDVEDVAQAAFINLLDSSTKPGFEYSARYVSHATKCASYAHFKHRKFRNRDAKLKDEFLPWEVPSSASAEEHYLGALDLETIFNEVCDFTAREREVFLGTLQGLTQKEIAASIGVSQCTVSSILASCRNNLREALSE